MRRWLSLPVLALLLAACQDRPEPTAPAGPEAPRFAVALDPALTDALSTATGSDTLEVVVNYDGALTTVSALTEALLELGAGVIQFKHLSMVAARATPTQITGMQTLVGVQSIYLNRQLEYLVNDGVRSIRADEVHALGVTGKGVGIAILDSGIDGAHPDLLYPSKTVANVKYVANLRDLYYFQGQINGTVRKGAEIFVDGVQNSESSIGHGTHVAGIAAGGGDASAGKYRGVAPGAHLVGIGAGDVLFIFWILAGFDYILEHREEFNIRVVNNSWGSSGMFDADDPINEATREVYDAGVTVVFSAGNCGRGDPTGVNCPKPDQNQVNPYSAAPWVISVAAGCKLYNPPLTATGRTRCEDAERADVLADFSSRGLAGDPLHHPDVTAPGVFIVSARASTGTVMNGVDADEDLLVCNSGVTDLDHYTCASGTSMSAPHVAGVVALLQEAAGGTLTPDQVLEVLTRTARPLDGYAQWEVGAGYVDALAAVEALRK